MKQYGSIIPFPRRSDPENQTGNPQDIPKYPFAVVKRNSELKNRIDESQQESRNLIGLMIERCTNLVDATGDLVDYLEIDTQESEKVLQATWDRSNAIRERYLEVFGRISTAAGFNKISRTAVALDLSIACARSTADCILEYRLQIDPFMLELAIENEHCAQALYRGFCKLATNPIQVHMEVREALKRMQRIEGTYYQAMRQLATGDDARHFPAASQDSLISSLSGMFNVFEQREIYGSLFKSAKRLIWTANRLRDTLPSPIHIESIR